MAAYHYLTPAETQRLAERRKANPALELTATERAVLRQREAEGQAQAQADAKSREAARQAAAVPEHERRPVNAARVILERRLAADRPGNRQSASILESLETTADERDREIQAEMEAKRRAHLLATDPDVRGAVQYGESAIKLATVSEDREAWARLVGIAKEGDTKAFWTEARALNATVAEREKAKQAEVATEKTAADVKYLEQKARADKAVADLQVSMEQMTRSLATPAT